MDNPDDFFRQLYKHFNDRKIDLVISKMTANVKWANGMDGGFVYGQDAVRDYWTKQFTLISSNVTPLEIETDNGIVKIKVHQVVHSQDGKFLADETVYHYFKMNDNKIAEFTIGEKVKN